MPGEPASPRESRESREDHAVSGWVLAAHDCDHDPVYFRLDATLQIRPDEDAGDGLVVYGTKHPASPVDPFETDGDVAAPHGWHARSASVTWGEATDGGQA